MNVANTDHTALWQIHREWASAAQQHGHLKVAGKILSDALKEAEELGELNSLIVDQLRKLATIHCLRREYESAEHVYGMLLETQEKVLGSDHPSLVDTLDKLGVILRERGRREEAMVLGYKALSLRTKAVCL